MISVGKITILAVFLLTFCTGLFLIAAWTVDEAIKYEPQLTIGSIDTTKPTALSFLVFDVETHTEIASKDSTKVLPIASITKLLAASLFYSSAELDATTTITWSDLKGDGEAGRLKPYEEYSYRSLLYPLLLESSNDAAEVLLRVAPNLVDNMNAYAKQEGLTATAFVDTSGLSDKNVSTAYELFLLSRDLYPTYPHIFDITSLGQFIGTQTGWLNNNPLVDEEGYKGGKHGFTYEANRTVIAYFDETLASGQTRTMGYIVLGSNDLKADIGLLREEVRKNVRLE